MKEITLEVTIPIARYEELLKKEQALETLKQYVKYENYVSKDNILVMIEVKPATEIF